MTVISNTTPLSYLNMSDGSLTLLEPVNTHQGSVFTLTLGPGEVRYIRAEKFFATDVEDLIAQIKQLTPCPAIKDPSYFADDFHLTTIQGKEMPGSTRRFIQLIEGETWDVQLRLQHIAGQMVVKEGLPISVYYLFHAFLCLGKQFDFNCECLEAWVKVTENDRET